MRTIAIFGGTFDPVHNGHIETSKNIQTTFHFNNYYFLPCKTPTMKPATTANNLQRITMLELALKQLNDFSIDLREMNRDTPSYMVDTLTTYRTEYKNASITLILGYDAFLSLPKWHHWEQIITLAHLLVINRNQFATTTIPEALQELLIKHKSKNKTDLQNNKAGIIYEFDAGNYLISSTEIKKELKNQLYIDEQLPIAVYQYIKEQKLYQ
jgi:nicotinate-nucleotide adenylyltransferase